MNEKWKYKYSKIFIIVVTLLELAIEIWWFFSFFKNAIADFNHFKMKNPLYMSKNDFLG